MARELRPEERVFELARLPEREKVTEGMSLDGVSGTCRVAVEIDSAMFSRWSWSWAPADFRGDFRVPGVEDGLDAAGSLGSAFERSTRFSGILRRMVGAMLIASSQQAGVAAIGAGER